MNGRVDNAHRGVAPILATDTPSSLVKYNDWICVINRTENLAGPSHSYESSVAGMACINAATIPLPDQKVRLNGPQQVEDSFNFCLGNWGSSFTDLYKLFLGAIVASII